ncbi:MAG TPA: ArsR family transcriptional regulator [Methanothermococcus okinawensis]|uniref:ArsR family transcriptional regulator n=1 Tax=Methanothermococcus okinawensis TaxID=155863 RepID=A0A832ZCF7_9EURY|nr:ArsR family transcriptional regulator [Methanococcaceae archaeon]HIP84563.1 ArsR family transcriptional regulator [Methanothermococcus okinawensis]HIP90817.1 ArsR family transcriptional regulator [Methanothermococcus okinawensis]
MKLEGTTKRIMELLTECNTVKEISSRLHLHPKNVDKYIRVLRDLGLVTTKKGKYGGVYLTEEGKYLVERGHVSLLTRKIRIVAEDRRGLLADISSKISEIGGNILSTTLEREKDHVIIWLEIENIDVEELKRVLGPYIKSLVVV